MLQPGVKERIGRLARPLRTPPLGPLFRDFERALRRFDPAKSVASRACPLLLVQGGLDELVPPLIAERLFRLAAPPKKLLRRPGAYHDFLESRAWLCRRVASWLVEALG